MSATNRGAKRAEADNYPTPSWCTRRILEAADLPMGGDWIEPCAGEGAIVRQLRGRVADLSANDIRDCQAELRDAGAHQVFHSDYLLGNWYRREVGITNPPFSIAEAVVRRMLTHCDYVVVLVRQGFVGHGRASWMRDNMPDTYELPDRPSFVSKAVCRECGFDELVPHGTEQFCGCGAKMRVSMATDAADYCWLVWTPERGRKWGRRYILPSTPLAERKAG